jgi:hypothetical protein
MKSFLWFAVLLSVAALARADSLDGKVDVTPLASWAQADAGVDGMAAMLPTVKYVPRDGRNAALMLTVIPADAAKVSDIASLRSLLRTVSGPMQPPSWTESEIKEFKTKGGRGVYASFEDPSLVGKPSKPGDFRFATLASVLLPGPVVVQATLFTDAADSADFREGMEIMQSLAGHASVPLRRDSLSAIERAGRVQLTRSTLHTVLRLPTGVTSPAGKLNRDPGYFSYSNKAGDGMMFSGWMEPAAGFDGDMARFWAGEKKGLARGGFETKDETLKQLGGWQVVTYVTDLGPGAVQKHLRACKVVGDTWVDVHLSVSTPTATWKQLEDALRATEFESTQH